MISRRAFSAVSLALAAAPAFAQSPYPERPVRVIVPFGPGGLADVTTRIVAEKLSERLGQQFVIVNQPGAGGAAAARAALSSPADGYTLILFTNGTAISVPLVANLGYDPLTQFRPISALGYFDFVFVTSMEHSYTSLGDFLAAAKARPGALNVGTINVGSSQNLSASLLKLLAGVDFAIVPFRTTPDAITALIRKDIDLVIDGYVATKSLLQEGKLRALATSGPTRSASLPDIPTAMESGVRDFEVTSWNALYAHADTPAPILRQLNEAVRAALDDPGVRQRLLDLGIEAKGGAPDEIAARLRADIQKWSDVIQRAGVARQ